MTSIEPGTAFLPIISKVRELDAKLLLACHLTRLGTSVVVGESGPVNALAHQSPPGICLSSILVPDAARRLQGFRAEGHTVLGWDEEGLVYPDAHFYVGDRLDADSVTALHGLIAWGDQQAEDIGAERPEWCTPIVALGNPRVDLLREPYRELAAATPAARERRAPYLLVNTNFDLVNHADGNEVFLERLRASRRITSPGDEERFASWARFRREIFESFLAGLPEVCAAFPELPIVVRPHPSERLETWFEFARALPSVEVAPAVDNVVPWIRGACAVLHNSCTTAVEAYVLGVPAIAFRPASDVQRFESPLPNDLSRCASTWKGVVDELRAVLDGDAAAHDALDRHAARHLASLEGPHASARIAKYAVALHAARAPGVAAAARTVAPVSRPSRFLDRARNALGRRRATPTLEASQRFPGLELDEVLGRITELERLTHTRTNVAQVAPNAFLISPVGSDAIEDDAELAGLHVAYVVQRYPKVSHVFIQREVAALRGAGARIDTYSLRTAEASELLSELDRDEAARTTALRPLSAKRLATVHLGAFRRAPRGYLTTLGRALAVSPPGLRARIWQLFYFGQAVMLHELLRTRRARHVHAHLANVAADVTWLAVELANRSGDDRWTWSFTMHGPTEFHEVERFNLRHKVEAADLVVCISEYCRAQLGALAGESARSKLVIVHCGVDTRQTPIVDRTDRMPRHLLNVGRLVPEKAQYLMLQTVAELVDRGRDVTATIVGDGPEAEGLRRLRHALDLDRRVALPGALGQPDLPEQFASADAFLMPSFDEGVPVVLMEAMACGLPVVATRIAGVPELVDDGVSGLLVTPGRVDELANAVERLFDDADLRAALAKAGRAAVEERFDSATEALALGAHFRARSRSERR